MVVRNKKTADSVTGLSVAKHRTSATKGSGLGLKVKRSSTDRASGKTLNHCYMVLCRATIAVLARMSEGKGRSLLFSSRRLIATSRFARGFSFGVNRCHGIIAPSHLMGAIRLKFLTGSRAGGLMANRFLERGISYPARLALPVGKGWQFTQLVQGAFAMMLTPTRSVSTAFPSVPEPFFKPVTSNAGDVSRFDVSEDLSAILECCTSEYESAGRDPSLFHKTIRFNVLRGVIEDVMQFCDETLGRACNPNRVMGVHHG